MRDYCETSEYTDGVLDSRKTSLLKAAGRGAIELPKYVGEWKSGKAKYFRHDDLISQWPSYRKQLLNLPCLRPEFHNKQTAQSEEKSEKSGKGKPAK